MPGSARGTSSRFCLSAFRPRIPGPDVSPEDMQGRAEAMTAWPDLDIFRQFGTNGPPQGLLGSR